MTPPLLMSEADSNWIVECDVCHARLDVPMSRRGQAIVTAVQEGWYVGYGKVLCPKDPPAA